MSATIVRYKTKPERADDNQALIEKVFAQLNADRPDGLEYATFRLEDGVTFVHVAFVEGENPLFQLAAFQDFAKNIAERCDEPPVAMGGTTIGSYNFGGRN